MPQASTVVHGPRAYGTAHAAPFLELTLPLPTPGDPLRPSRCLCSSCQRQDRAARPGFQTPASDPGPAGLPPDEVVNDAFAVGIQNMQPCERCIVYGMEYGKPCSCV